MRYPLPSDPELMTAINRYVTTGDGPDRRYLTLLHGNVLGLGAGDWMTGMRLTGQPCSPLRVGSGNGRP